MVVLRIKWNTISKLFYKLSGIICVSNFIVKFLVAWFCFVFLNLGGLVCFSWVLEITFSLSVVLHTTPELLWDRIRTRLFTRSHILDLIWFPMVEFHFPYMLAGREPKDLSPREFLVSITEKQQDIVEWEMFLQSENLSSPGVTCDLPSLPSLGFLNSKMRWL